MEDGGIFPQEQIRMERELLEKGNFRRIRHPYIVLLEGLELPVKQIHRLYVIKSEVMAETAYQPHVGIGGACMSPVGVWLASLSPDWAIMRAAANRGYGL